MSHRQTEQAFQVAVCLDDDRLARKCTNALGGADTVVVLVAKAYPVAW